MHNYVIDDEVFIVEKGVFASSEYVNEVAIIKKIYTNGSVDIYIYQNIKYTKEHQPIIEK